MLTICTRDRPAGRYLGRPESSTKKQTQEKTSLMFFSSKSLYTRIRLSRGEVEYLLDVLERDTEAYRYIDEDDPSMLPSLHGSMSIGIEIRSKLWTKYQRFMNTA